MLHGKKDFNDGMMYFVSVFWHLKNYTDSSSKGSTIKGQDFKTLNDHIFYITGPIWMNLGRLMDLVIVWPWGCLCYLQIMACLQLYLLGVIMLFKKYKAINNCIEMQKTDLNHKYPDA